jgi:hypothetical protein
MNKIKLFLSKVFNKKTKVNKNPITVNEIKKMYKGMSRSDLIRALIKLATENEMLKARLKGK